MRYSVVLPLQQMMKSEVLGGASGPGTIRLQPALNNLGGPFNRAQLSLEDWGFLAVRMMQAGIAGGQSKQAFARGVGFRLCFLNQGAQNFAVAFG